MGRVAAEARHGDVSGGLPRAGARATDSLVAWLQGATVPHAIRPAQRCQRGDPADHCGVCWLNWGRRHCCVCPGQGVPAGELLLVMLLCGCAVACQRHRKHTHQHW